MKTVRTIVTATWHLYARTVLLMNCVHIPDHSFDGSECSMSGRSRAAVLLAAMVTLGAVLVPSAHAVPRAPDTAVLDGARLQRTKLRLDEGDHQLHRGLGELTTRADN